jgi:hypothetical protein
MAERCTGNQLAWHEHLEVDPEVALARYRVRTVGHEPQHPFGAYIPEFPVKNIHYVSFVPSEALG